MKKEEARKRAFSEIVSGFFGGMTVVVAQMYFLPALELKDCGRIVFGIFAVLLFFFAMVWCLSRHYEQNH